MGRKKDWANMQQIIHTKISVVDRIISTEILSKELKPAALENFEFENRQNMNII